MDNVFDAINLMLSIIAICVSIHAIRITRVHNKLSVEPICAIIERYHEHNLAVVIVNRGLGAMIIDSVTVFKNDIERHNLIEFMPKVNQLWNGFSLEIKKRAILPDHELVLCAIDPESKEIRDQILSALADITRLLQIMCKPPEWCKIEASHRRFYYGQKESHAGRKGPAGENPRTAADGEYRQHG